MLIAGGTDGTNYFTAAQLFNPANGTWSATGSMAIARSQFAAVVLPSGKVLVEGGSTGNGSAIFASAELYDPSTGTWSSGGYMSVARYAHTATLLPDGTVMVTGHCVSSSCSSVTGLPKSTIRRRRSTLRDTGPQPTIRLTRLARFRPRLFSETARCWKLAVATCPTGSPH